jgi:hypothetical protein
MKPDRSPEVFGISRKNAAGVVEFVSLTLVFGKRYLAVSGRTKCPFKHSVPSAKRS